MALEVTENTAAQVTQYPDVSAPVSGTATFHNAQGVADSTPAVTVDVIGTGGAAVVQASQRGASIGSPTMMQAGAPLCLSLRLTAYLSPLRARRLA